MTHRQRAPHAVRKSFNHTKNNGYQVLHDSRERAMSERWQKVCGSWHVSMWWAGVTRSSLHCHYRVHAASSIYTQLQNRWIRYRICGGSVPMLRWLLLCMWSGEVLGFCSPPTAFRFSVLSRQVKLPPYIFWLWHIDCEPRGEAIILSVVLLSPLVS